jgi:hypothetical protein
MAALPIIAIAASAAGSIMQGMQKSQQAGAEQSAAQANAAYDTAAGKTAFMSAASQAAQGNRSGAEAIGSQAAAIGQSGSGIADASSQNVIRQSETNQRMDFLNKIYGGQVSQSQYNVQAQQQDYAAKVAGLNKQNAMYGGFMTAGTTALSGVAQYRMGTGGGQSTTPTL